MLFDDYKIRKICDVLADTTRGYSKSELQSLLKILGIEDIEKSGKPYFSKNKRTWLNDCLLYEVRKNDTDANVVKFIELAMNPMSFTKAEAREKYNWLFEELNKVLVLAGIGICKDGRMIKIIKADSLDEADKRVNSLRKKLSDRCIHSEVEKYCRSDLMRKDYSAVVFEASKGLAQRVRDMTGLSKDGGELFQATFSTKDPWLVFNQLKTENEISEFKGLKELMESIFHLVRNPVAHTPRIKWNIEENKALDVLTLISFAHKYLDVCVLNPIKRNNLT